MIKINTQQTGKRGKLPQQNKAIYKKSKANIIFNSERLKAFFLQSGTRQECPLSSLSVVLEVLPWETRQEINNKSHPNWKENHKIISVCDGIIL